jgi:hypothetical protein
MTNACEVGDPQETSKEQPQTRIETVDEDE